MKSSISKRIIIPISVLLFLVFFVIGAYRLAATPVSTSTSDYPISYAKSAVAVDSLSEEVNGERKKVGVPPLILDDRLNKAAQVKADEMRTEGYFDHVNPKTGKHGYSYAYEYVGDQCKLASENMTQAVTDSGATRDWMQSRPHREAILNRDNTLVGYGINGDYVVQLFCQTK